MPTTLPAQIPKAFAGAIAGGADTHMEQLTQAEAMDLEAPPADEAGDFPQDIVARPAVGRNAKDSDSRTILRPHERNRSRFVGHTEPSLATILRG
jgi:hypothetical protein